MRTRTERNRHPRSRSGSPPALLLALLLLLVPLATAWIPAPAALAQDAPAEGEPQEQEAAAAEPAGVEERGPDEERLRATVEERYRVLPAREGVVLVPREEMVGIRSIQVTPGEVAINGELVSPAILRSWLGAEADPLLDLAALEGAELRGLLTLEPAEEEPAEAAEEAEAGEAADAADDGEPSAPPAPPEAPEAPEAPRVQLGQQFKMGNDVVIDADEVATEAVALGGSVLVRGKVRRDVVAIGGRVEVEGEVGGEIVAILGGVVLGPDAVVRGNVISVGGEVRRAPGARVGGDVSEVSGPYVGRGDFDWEDWADRDRTFVRGWRVQEAYWNLVGAALLALLACLALLVARGPVERVEARIRKPGDFLVAGLVGLAVFLLLGPVLLIVTLLLVITIVGCLALPLIPFALLALAVAALFGYAAVALRIGRWCESRFGWRFGSPYVAVLLGVAVIEVWRLLGEGLEIFGGPAWFFAVMFLVLGVLVELVAWAVALGAVLMNLVDRRPPPAAYGGTPPELPPGPAPGAPPSTPPQGGGAPPPPSDLPPPSTPTEPEPERSAPPPEAEGPAAGTAPTGEPAGGPEAPPAPSPPAEAPPEGRRGDGGGG